MKSFFKMLESILSVTMKAIFLNPKKDFFRMYECMLRLSPNDPLTAFSVVGLLAVGPFEELHKMKRFDGYLPDPECQMKLHMQHRFYFDPPEFQVNPQCHFLALKF